MSATMIPASFTSAFVRANSSFTGNAVRNGALTKTYKRFVKSSDGNAPLPRNLAFNPVTKRIVKASSVYDLRFKERTPAAYKKSIRVRIQAAQPPAVTSTVTTLDALSGFKLYRHKLTGVNTIEGLYQQIRAAIDFLPQGGFVRLHFQNANTNKTFFRNISNVYLDSFEDFRDRVAAVQEGEAIGSDALSEDEWSLMLNVFDLFETKIGGDGKADSILFKCVNTEVKNSQCWSQVFQTLDPELKDIQPIAVSEIPVCQHCKDEGLPEHMFKCDVAWRRKDNTPYWCCRQCKAAKDDGTVIRKPIKECNTLDAKRFKYGSPSNRGFVKFTEILGELGHDTGKKVCVVANTFKIVKVDDEVVGTRNIRKDCEEVVFEIPNGKKAPKKEKANRLTMDSKEIEPYVLWTNSDSLTDPNDFDMIVIYDEIKQHYDIAKGKLEFDNVVLGRGNTVYRWNAEKKMARPLYRFNDLNKMNKTNHKITEKFLFFDIETVIDVNARNIMKEYSISFCVFTADDLEKLSIYDKKKDKKNLDAFIGLHTYNFVGYDCLVRFVKWILENQYIKIGKNETFNLFHLISFNGANFDNFLLLNSLLDLDNDFGQEMYVNEIFYNGSQILNFRINNKHGVFDIAKHLVGSLDSNCKGFGVNCVAKTSFDHHKAQKLHDEGKLIEYMTGNEELIDYNNRDVLSLAVIFQRYCEALDKMPATKMYAKNLCSRKTIGGMVWDIATRHMKNLKVEQDTTITTGRGKKKVSKTHRIIRPIEFPKLDQKQYDDMLKYKSAGRVELFNGIQHIKEQMCSKDICSMYPYVMAVMKDAYYPCGEMHETATMVDDKMGWYYCDIDQSNLEAQNLPLIIAEKVFTKKADGSDGPLEGNNWGTKKVLKDYFISTVQIAQLKKYGCDVTVKNGIYFSDKVRGCDLFEFLLEFMQKKNEQDVYKKSKSELYNAALRETLKLCSNSLSGKAIEGLHLEKTVATDSYGFLKIQDSEKTEQITTINIIGSKVFTTYKVTQESQMAKQRPVYIGCLIYAYAQKHIYDTLFAVVGKKDMVYCDTDAGKLTKRAFARPDVQEFYKTAKVQAWDKAVEYDPKLEDHLLYDPNSKVYGSYEEELPSNKESYFVQKKGYIIIGEKDDNTKIGFKGVPKRALLLKGDEPFMKGKDFNDKQHGWIVKYTIQNQKDAIDYFNEHRERQIQHNAKEFGATLFKKRYAYVLTTSFRKIVKNTRVGVDKEDEARFQKMNNTVQVVAIVKRITLKE
mgnify:CR=1 FL=1